MVSDRPRRSKIVKQEGLADPLQNSLVGSLRNSVNLDANARLKENAGKIKRDGQQPIQLSNTQVPTLTLS